MPFEFVCPYCHNRTKVLDRYAGQTGPCVGCGKMVTMPHFNAQGVLVPALDVPKKSKTPWERKKFGWMPAVIGVSVVGLILSLGIVSAFALWPRVRQGLQRSAQSRDFENMKLIQVALSEYSDRYGSYPPPVTCDAAGKPLYSWRVMILPFLGYEDLYNQFDLKQPWDSVANSNLHRRMPTEFASPNSPDALTNHETNFVLVTGPGTLFPPSGPISNRNIDKPTLLLVETKNNTIWCAPGDIDLGRSFRVGNKPMVDVGGLHRDSFTAMTVEGEPFRIPLNVPQAALDALVTPNGGENVQTSTFKE